MIILKRKYQLFLRIMPFVVTFAFVLWMFDYSKTHPDDPFTALLIGLPPTVAIMGIIIFVVFRIAKSDQPKPD